MSENFDSKSISKRIAGICSTLINAWKIQAKKPFILNEERRLVLDLLCQEQGISSQTIINILSHNGDY